MERLASLYRPIGERLVGKGTDMDFLWRDLAKNSNTYVSPEWHVEILAQRMANPSTVPRLPLDEAIQDVKQRLNARHANISYH